MDLSMMLVKADIIAARQAIDYYEKKHIKEIKNIAAYHLQQACEKLIKLQIYRSGVQADNAKLYVHNLIKLISYGRCLNFSSFLVPKAIDSNALLITDWEAGSRYDLQFTVRINIIKTILHEVEKWYDVLYRGGIR